MSQIHEYLQKLCYLMIIVTSATSTISASRSHTIQFPAFTTQKNLITAILTLIPMDSITQLETSLCRIYVSFCTKNPNGNVSSSIRCYNLANHSWHHVTFIPGLNENEVLKDFAMIALDDYIYIIGGRVCRKELDPKKSDFKENNLNVISCVHRYNVKTDEWETCEPLSIPRFNFACTVCEGKIYVAGGQGDLDRAKGISSAEVYDPALDEWKSLANMSTVRYKCVGVTWKGKIHVVGGFAHRGSVDDIHGPYITTRSSAEVYDPQCNEWDFKARMWELDVPPREIVDVDGKLYSSGDCFKPWKGHIEAYDEKENMWNEVFGSNSNCLSTNVKETNWKPMHMLYLTMAPIGNKLYFLVGYRMPGEASGFRSEVHVFDTTLDRGGWKSFEPIEEEREKELCSRCCVIKQES